MTAPPASDVVALRVPRIDVATDPVHADEPPRDAPGLWTAASEACSVHGVRAGHPHVTPGYPAFPPCCNIMERRGNRALQAATRHTRACLPAIEERPG